MSSDETIITGVSEAETLDLLQCTGLGELSELLVLRSISPIWDREPAGHEDSSQGSETSPAHPHHSDSEQSSELHRILSAIRSELSSMHRQIEHLESQPISHLEGADSASSREAAGRIWLDIPGEEPMDHSLPLPTWDDDFKGPANIAEDDEQGSWSWPCQRTRRPYCGNELTPTTAGKNNDQTRVWNAQS